MKRTGQFLIFVPLGIFVLLFIAGVAARFVSGDPKPSLGSFGLIFYLDLALLLSFLPLIITIPIGLFVWWKAR